MIFIRKTIKNRFLNILILLGITFTSINLNAFSINSLIKGPKNTFNSFVESARSNPVDFVVGATLIAAFLAVSVSFVVSELNKSKAQKDAYDKKIKETCVVCDKTNKECKCNLLEKIEYVFVRKGFVETQYYLDDNYTHRSCNWLTKKIKSVILKINDINMRFNYYDGNETILHIACYYGHELIIKWLVEDMFVDINAVNSKGFTASKVLKDAKALYASKRGVVNETSTSKFYFLSEIDDCILDKKVELQKELLSCVKSVKSLLEENKSQEALKQVCQDVKIKLAYIKNLIVSKKTPGFAKQLVMSDLVFMNQNFKEFIEDKQLLEFYKCIAFNYTFLNDSRFAIALKFAETNNIKDIYDRSVAQAREIYTQENKDIRCERAEDFIEPGYYYSSRF